MTRNYNQRRFWEFSFG